MVIGRNPKPKLTNKVIIAAQVMIILCAAIVYTVCQNNVPIVKEGVSVFFQMDISIQGRICAPELVMKSCRLVAT